MYGTHDFEAFYSTNLHIVLLMEPRRRRRLQLFKERFLCLCRSLYLAVYNDGRIHNNQ